ncbi:reticulon-1 isoform X1 [Eublepharis macularius]|uniref:Reticulon n=1 Tax=Eublepharis macularius TaxID=481883 RepID=A0AA97IXM9_EUBMA|nr:reticulon-1 isoform X1 [Eublepharis macularius]
MAAPPDHRHGSEQHWVGDGAEDESAAGAAARRWDAEGAQQPAAAFGSAKEPPPVAMATASTGGMAASHLYDFSSSKASDRGNGSFYTSLISDDLYTSPQDSSYFTGILPKEESTEGFHAQDGTAFESRGLFSSDSGIEMTPAESTDVNKTFADPMEQMKSEAYKYMDISRSEEIKYQERCDTGLGDVGPPSWINKFEGDTTGPKGTAFEEQPVAKKPDLFEGTIFPSETFGDHQYHVSVEAPVKITLTEIESIEGEPATKEKIPEKQELGLKPSHEVVPTVTVSEPEDDSPGSITPPSSGTELSGSESQGKGSLSEEELINAIKEAKGFSYERPKGQPSPVTVTEKQDPKSKSSLPAGGPPLDNEASSAESGDSEIELVSEDPLAAEEVLHSNYMTFSHAGGPPPSPASPSIQYSILREEREAELDSELIIESCDASSASEESPKREHDSPLMKPVIMDIIQEENNSRNESRGASNYNVNSSKESRMNRENLADSASYLKCSFATPKANVDLSSSSIAAEETKNKIAQKKSADMAAATVTSQMPSKGPVTRSPWPSPPLPFLNKQKAIDLLYWRDIKQTGIMFGSILLLLFSLTQFSVVSVIAYLALAALSATISFRIYKSVLQAVQKTDEGHPFKNYLEMEMSLSQEQIQKYTDCLQLYVNNTVKELRRLFLVQDLVDSLKFAVLMWLLTYVGALFNGLTLLIMAVVSMFTLPVVYDKYQAQIDQYLGLVRTHMNTVVAKIQAKIPGAKRKAE